MRKIFNVLRRGLGILCLLLAPFMLNGSLLGPMEPGGGLTWEDIERMKNAGVFIVQGVLIAALFVCEGLLCFPSATLELVRRPIAWVMVTSTGSIMLLTFFVPNFEYSYRALLFPGLLLLPVLGISLLERWMSSQIADRKY